VFVRPFPNVESGKAPVLMLAACCALYQPPAPSRSASAADRQSVPAHIVFSDKVLLEMVARRPENEVELLDVPGVGPAKLEKYGPAFLAELVARSGGTL